MENRKRPGLTTAIFIGLALGAAAGILLHYAVPEGDIRDKLLIDGLFYLIGNGFLRLMQMLVVPLVFCSLVCGSMSMGDTKTWENRHKDAGLLSGNHCTGHHRSHTDCPCH
mgnify:FL=1